MNKYLIGATWEGKEMDEWDYWHRKIINHNRTARIWLEKCENGIEIWRYITTYPSGATDQFNWGTSYQNVRNQITFKCKMRRIK